MSEESAKRFRQEQAQMLESLQEKLDDKKEQLRKSQEQESKLESRIIDAELDLASSVKDLSVVKGQYDAEVLAKEKLANQFEGLEALHEITNEGLKNLQQNNAELEHQISSLMAVRSNEKGQASLLASMHAKAKQLENILSVEKSENKKLLLRISNLEKKITSLMSRSGVVVTPAPRKRYPPVAGDD
jgi:CII-binding regulator of phage lambda lysogenization HflD